MNSIPEIELIVGRCVDARQDMCFTSMSLDVNRLVQWATDRYRSIMDGKSSITHAEALSQMERDLCQHIGLPTSYSSNDVPRALKLTQSGRGFKNSEVRRKKSRAAS